MNRTEILQGLIDLNDYKSFLEIGLGEGRNFHNIRCDVKVGVDPFPSIKGMGVLTTTSDEFFEFSKEKFDLIFIDGLHHSDQVEKDIVNAYKKLKKGGMLMIHDCNPWNERMTSVPRETLAWTGDVFRAVAGLIAEWDGKIPMKYFNERAGLLGVYKKHPFYPKVGFAMNDLSYGDWVANHRDKMLGL